MRMNANEVTTGISRPTKITNPTVPPSVISPTSSSASVSRPCALSPEVAARTQITSLPPSPATSPPATNPAVVVIASVRSASSADAPAVAATGSRAATTARLRPRHEITSASNTAARQIATTRRLSDRIGGYVLFIGARTPAHNEAAARIGIDTNEPTSPT